MVARIKWISLVAMVSLVSNLSAAASEIPCPEALRKLNKNVLVGRSHYQQLDDRSVADYEYDFKQAESRVSDGGFYQKVRSLKAGDRVIDLGSGRGYALLELARRYPGLNTVAIDAPGMAEYWNTIVGLPDLVRRLGFGALQISDAFDREKVEGIANLHCGFLRQLFAAAGIRSPTWMEEAAKVPTGFKVNLATVRKDLNRIVRKINEIRRPSRFEDRTGMAEDVIREYENSATLIIDDHGPFYYGAERIPLLEGIYAALKPGGKAFISLGNKSRDCGHDEVTLADGKTKEELPDYLVRKYPHIFSLRKNGAAGRYLVVSRNRFGRKRINLNLRITETGNHLDYSEAFKGFVVPSLKLEEVVSTGGSAN